MHVVKIPFDQKKAAEMWPSFVPNIEDKHGSSGHTGNRLEEAAVSLVQTHFPGVEICIDHSTDVVGQFYGIDYTLIKRDRSITVDVKGGRTGVYWDRDNRYWYVTIRDDFFNERKINSHFMHVGPKGDLYAIYSKRKMKEHIEANPHLLIPDTYGSRLKIKDLPQGSDSNINAY